MSEASLAAEVAALRAFVCEHLAAIDIALRIPQVHQAQYLEHLRTRPEAAAAAAVKAGMDEASAAQLGASIAADVELARQTLSRRDAGRGLPNPPPRAAKLSTPGVF